MTAVPIRFSNSAPCADMTSRSRRASRARFARNVPPSEDQRAQGMPGAQCAEASHAVKKAYELVTTVTPERPGIPRAMVLRLTSRSPRLPRLFDTVACASYRRLDANDWGVRTTRLDRPRQHHSSSAPTASTASGPTLMTCATPLLSRPDGESVN